MNLDGDLAFFFLLFAGIKLAGYTGVAALAKSAFPATRAPAALIGGARTLLGIMVGLLLGQVSFAFTDNVFWFYAALLPVRFGEWYVIFRSFLEDRHQRKPRTRWLLLGVAASYGLDIPAALGFLSVGRAWIC